MITQSNLLLCGAICFGFGMFCGVLTTTIFLHPRNWF